MEINVEPTQIMKLDTLYMMIPKLYSESVDLAIDLLPLINKNNCIDGCKGLPIEYGGFRLVYNGNMIDINEININN